MVGSPVNLFRGSMRPAGPAGRPAKTRCEVKKDLIIADNFIPTVTMRSLLRPAPLFILASYLLLSLVPCVPILLGRQVPELGRILTVELLAWVTVWGVFQRPAWFHW